MAELSLRERLQPALLDRLLDEERLLSVYEITAPRETLQRLGITERNLIDIIAAQGLTPGAASAGDSGVLRLRFSAAVGRVAPSHLRALLLKPPGAPEGVQLQSFCTIEARNVVNDAAETTDRRHLSMRRLREYVCRDLAALLNSASLDVSVDLTPFPEVQRSVLNYGLPSLAGRSASSVDPQRIAQAIEEVIRRFEPRLLKVRVLPDTERDHGDGHRLAFRIEAELWGQPVPQHLVLRTYISTESGDVNVTDSGAK